VGAAEAGVDAAAMAVEIVEKGMPLPEGAIAATPLACATGGAAMLLAGADEAMTLLDGADEAAALLPTAAYVV